MRSFHRGTVPPSPSFQPHPCRPPSTLISFPATLSPVPSSQSRDRSKPASTRRCSFLLVFKTPCCPNFPLPVSLPPLLPPVSAHPQNVSVPLGWALVCPYSICTSFLGDCPPSHNSTCDIHTDALKCVSEAPASLSVLDSYFRLSVWHVYKNISRTS